MVDQTAPTPNPQQRQPASIASILLDAEEHGGHRPALYVDDRVLSFGDVADQSRRMAAYLTALGVSQGARVAMQLPNGAAFVTTHYALALVGAVIVPINPQLSGPVVAEVLERSEAVCLVTTESHAEALSAVVSSQARLELVVVKEEGGSLSVRTTSTADPVGLDLTEMPPSQAFPDTPPDDPALLFFTSGTTGRPKGVLLTHAQALFGIDAWATRWSFGDHTISLMAAPYFHVVYNPLVLGAHRRMGATVALSNVSVPAVTAAVARHRATALMSTPAFMRQLASERWTRRHDLSSLDTLIYGAAPTPPAVIRSLGAFFPDTDRYNCYGMTETSSALTCLGGSEVAGRESSVGRPHPGVRLMIADARGTQVPDGHSGEVCAQGPGVITSYFRAPDIDAQRFFGPWLRTGDVGHIDEDGFLTLLDRLDDQINIAGEKFYPSQVEEALCSDPTVGEAAAVGVPDEKKGEVIVAFVVAEADHELNLEVLRRRCAERLPNCAIPKRITILSEIPRNPTGKVLRRELGAMAES